MKLTIELEREEDGRWIAEALETARRHGLRSNAEEAIGDTERLAIDVIADRISHGELSGRRLQYDFHYSR
jgi:hypothetical protein